LVIIERSGGVGKNVSATDIFSASDVAKQTRCIQQKEKETGTVIY
jgi:hypothetical protein